MAKLKRMFALTLCFVFIITLVEISSFSIVSASDKKPKKEKPGYTKLEKNSDGVYLPRGSDNSLNRNNTVVKFTSEETKKCGQPTTMKKNQVANIDGTASGNDNTIITSGLQNFSNTNSEKFTNPIEKKKQTAFSQLLIQQATKVFELNENVAYGVVKKTRKMAKFITEIQMKSEQGVSKKFPMVTGINGLIPGLGLKK